ncbi:MAG: epoxide hydrolase family protein [Streptosporangiaceae bacterium]
MLRVPDADLEELRSRLRGTRWPRPWPAGAGDGWEAGASASELRRLAGYWAEGYDWRVQEAAINALPGQVASIDGTVVFYLRFDAETPGALPIVLTHGWPSTFLELTELARRLAAPSRYGGQASDAFTVIVPALPGFPLSPQRPALPSATPAYELWHRLMHDELGFPRYAAHGGDLGAGVTSLLGQEHPEAVAGIHLLAVADPPGYDQGAVTAEERGYLDAAAAWFADNGGYEHEQMTRPLTLSFGLSDSPVGLLAWLTEKYRAWSDNDGDLSRRFSDDFILAQASLYWFSNTISTSFRPYYEYARGFTPRVRQVSVPTAVAVFPKDLSQPPRSWAERTYHLTRYTVMPRGGHFAAHEEPQLLAADLTEFFRPLR